jgi:nucleoside-diphosphate-sugar epimerase
MLQHQNAAPVAPTRVVVVGAGGFVGNAIARRLERDQVPVLRLTRREVDLLSPEAADRLGAQLHSGDTLVAAAALAPCKTAEMLRDNIALALALVKAAAAVPLAQVINISSDAVYADSPAPLTEASATAPDTLHGVMHLAREVMFRSEIKAPLATLRPSLLYGAGDPHNGYGPNRFRRLAHKGEPIVLFGEGEERRDQVLIDDVAGKFGTGGFGAVQAQPTPDQKLDFVAKVLDGDGDSGTSGFSVGIDGTGPFDDGLVSGVALVGVNLASVA